MRRALLALVILGTVFITPAQAASNFTVSCKYHHTLSDDPIVYPNQPGASHSHEFLGNTTTSAMSIFASMYGKPTTCGNAGNMSGYWVPTLYRSGVAVHPSAVKAYYYRRVSGTISPFPKGLQIIAGNSSATAPQPTSVVYWGCGNGSGISKVNAPPNCTGHSDTTYVHISFPDCSTGAATSPDHRSHMAYSSGGACPSAYPVHVPQLVMRMSYPITDARSVTLASGAAYTMHADYFSVWNETELARLVATL